MNPVAALRTVSIHGPRDDYPVWHSLHLWCPGCDGLHAVNLVGPTGDRPPERPCWDWDGNLEAPTISPSILTHEIRKDDGTVYSPTCHSFVRAGRWEFLGDCGHALAGQTVDMVPLPDWLVSESAD